MKIFNKNNKLFYINIFGTLVFLNTLNVSSNLRVNFPYDICTEWHISEKLKPSLLCTWNNTDNVNRIKFMPKQIKSQVKLIFLVSKCSYFTSSYFTTQITSLWFNAASDDNEKSNDFSFGYPMPSRAAAVPPPILLWMSS